MTLTLDELLNYVETCCGEPEVRAALSRDREKARGIAEFVAFSRRRQGYTPSHMEERLYWDAAAQGKAYFASYIKRFLGNPGRANEAQMRGLIRYWALGRLPWA
jgi:hypothetical protein